MSTALRLLALYALLMIAVGQHEGHNMSMSGHIHGATSNPRQPPARLPIPDSCVTKPAQANCSTFQYPLANAVNDLHRLCGAMPFMSGCSIATACNRSSAGEDNPTGPGAAKVSSRVPDVCQPFQQLITVCRLDTGMSRMAGCENHNSMCVTGSLVPACQMTGVTPIPTTKAINSQVKSICEAQPDLQDKGCAECTPSWEDNKTYGDCDLLRVYSQLCSEKPNMLQCVEYHNMCKADSSLIFCASYNDKAQQAASEVLSKGTPADKDAKQQAPPAGSSSSAKSAAGIAAAASSMSLMALAAALLVPAL